MGAGGILDALLHRGQGGQVEDNLDPGDGPATAPASATSPSINSGGCARWRQVAVLPRAEVVQNTDTPALLDQAFHQM